MQYTCLVANLKKKRKVNKIETHQKSNRNLPAEVDFLREKPRKTDFSFASPYYFATASQVNWVQWKTTGFFFDSAAFY